MIKQNIEMKDKKPKYKMIERRYAKSIVSEYEERKESLKKLRNLNINVSSDEWKQSIESHEMKYKELQKLKE